MKSRLALVLAVTALGCAMSSTRSRAPRYCVEPRRNAQQAAPADTPTAAPVSRTETLSTTSAGEDRARDEEEREVEPPCISPTGRITALESEVAQGMAAFAAPTADCRSACRAASGVCGASEEICRLTGDGASPTPLDPRCARARASCEDATRQRTDRCPVCPVE